jgi:hypothetical protein
MKDIILFPSSGIAAILQTPKVIREVLRIHNHASQKIGSCSQRVLGRKIK